ncbi:T9SS type A sorting domain-containing protein [bacterium]|nr:T9SS type A sorting domain-containing protein [bacterium]
MKIHAMAGGAAVLAAAALALAATAPAQTVGTLASGFNTNGDLAVDPDGNVYVSCENSDTVIRKIAPDGTVTDYATMSNTRGMAFEATGDTLYVARTNAFGAIRRVAPDGTATTLVNGFSTPTGLAFGPSGNLYVTDNASVTKVLPDGTKVALTSDPQLNRPHGIAVDETENIYVASAHDGNVWRIDSTHLHGSVNPTLFAHVDGLQQAWACGFMTYHDGFLYITNGDNKTHAISLSGVVSDYAGNGNWGWVDGPAADAEFMAPNGIAVDGNGRVFVAEYGVARVRVIEPAASTAVGTGPQRDASLHLAPNRPNPFGVGTVVSFTLAQAGPVRLRVFDAAGRAVRTLVEGARRPGRHTARWDGRADDGRNAGSGVYFCRLEAGGETTVRRMVLRR